jgi:hypothetical protein
MRYANSPPTKEVIFYVTVPEGAVLGWYREHFTAVGWSYDEKANVGDLTFHYVTSGFWKYNWYEKSDFVPTYSMNIETGTTPTGLTNVDILLRHTGDGCGATATSAPR